MQKYSINKHCTDDEQTAMRDGFSLLVSPELTNILGMHAGAAAIAAGIRNTEPIMLRV